MSLLVIYAHLKLFVDLPIPKHAGYRGVFAPKNKMNTSLMYFLHDLWETFPTTVHSRSDLLTKNSQISGAINTF